MHLRRKAIHGVLVLAASVAAAPLAHAFLLRAPYGSNAVRLADVKKVK